MPKESVTLAKLLASRLLKDVDFEPETKLGAVPLRKLAKVLDVPVVYCETDSVFQSEGALWNRQVPQPSLFGDVEAEIGASGLQKRFALAHELGHRIAKLYLTSGQTRDWTDHDWQRFLGEFSSRLLLPDSLLLAVVEPNKSLELTIQWIESTHRRVQVSISCLVKRLNDAAFEEILRLTNCALVVALGVSAKRKTDYAPRVIASCTPRAWFIPSNTRLSSLGLHSLSKLFWSAKPFVISTAEDSLTIQQRANWQYISVNRTFRYVVYQSATQEKGVLLTTFHGPD